MSRHEWRPLPAEVADLLRTINAPPRLTAHLTLVHDVTARLLEGISHHWPTVPLDVEAILLGAATHDIGKALYPEELTASGKRHEQAGYQLLLDHGWMPARARFARTHGEFHDDLRLEDLLVMLADRCWKGKRDDTVETAIARLLAPGEEPWQTFMVLDDIIQGVATEADSRLAWQASHPVAG